MKSELPSAEVENWTNQIRLTLAIAAGHHPEEDVIESYRAIREVLEADLAKHIAKKGQS